MSESDNETDSSRGPLAPVWLLILILTTSLAISYLIAVPIGLVTQAQRLSVQEIIFASAILVALAFAAQGKYAITDLTLSSSGISAHFNRINRIEKKQNELEADVRALQVALVGLVNKNEQGHLERLAADGPYIVRFGEIFVGELTRLDAMDYVQPVDKERGINAIRQDHGSGQDDFDLKRYVAITSKGREYLDLRNTLTSRMSSAG
jgi:hypothetical protein